MTSAGLCCLTLDAFSNVPRCAVGLPTYELELRTIAYDLVDNKLRN